MNANSLLASPTGLSPYLRFGCLSCRLFYYRLWDLYKKVRAQGARHFLPPVQPGGQALPGHSVTVKGAFSLAPGLGRGAWIWEVLECACGQRRWGRVRVQEPAGPGAAQTADLLKPRLPGRTGQAERLASGCVPRGGGPAGSRWVGAGWRQCSAGEHSSPVGACPEHWKGSPAGPVAAHPG